MSGDLLTLRMMVVSADEAVREHWREGAAAASMPIEYSAAEPIEALPALKRDGFDIVVLDAALPDHECHGVINVVRRATPVPLIAASGPSGAPRISGASAMLPNPGTGAEARALVERCIRMRLPKRVLIVDDSRTMRGIVRKILSASRFPLEVAEAEEGIAALRMLAEGYDLVLVDYNMPGFNGIQTLSQIKQVSPDVAVVIMTSTEDEALAGRAQSLGATAFLKKPFYPEDVDAVLAGLYDVPRHWFK
jgi:CheY-like chemotaxis protein